MGRGSVHFLYATVPGRGLLKLLQCTGALRCAERFLRSRVSKPVIKGYIKRNQIDMTPYRGQGYQSFQAFFVRRRADVPVDREPDRLISPCDGLLSAYAIREDSRFQIKGSWYRVENLVGDRELAERFSGGDCLILRLCPSDYHHYCFIDDGHQGENHFVEGTLHSVQPIACERVPVYRLNRRLWTRLDTENFGTVVQIEVGALLVGGIVQERENAAMRRGEEMGHFELAGSTIVLLFRKDTIELLPQFRKVRGGRQEIRIKMGEVIGHRTE